MSRPNLGAVLGMRTGNEARIRLCLTLNDDEYPDFVTRLLHVQYTRKLKDEHERVVELSVVLHSEWPHVNVGPCVPLLKTLKTRGTERDRDGREKKERRDGDGRERRERRDRDGRERRERRDGGGRERKERRDGDERERKEKDRGRKDQEGDEECISS